MAAVKTRAFIKSSGDYYLTPLSSLQVKPEQLKELVRGYYEGGHRSEEIFSDNGAGELEKVAFGYEIRVPMTSSDEDGDFTWEERRLVVCSVKQAEKGRKSLLERLAQAEQKIGLLNQKKQGKRIFRTQEELAQAVAKIVKKYKVSNLLDVEYTSIKTEKQVRSYGTRPASVREETEVTVTVCRNQEKLEEELSRAGWRVYATNQPAEELSFEQAVKAYWSQYLIERGIGRLKGKKLSLTPLYLTSQERVKGLVRLLSIGVRVLTGIEFQVRKKLDQEDTELSGIYLGNKKRATRRPTTELMLKAFSQVNLTRIEVNGQTMLHLTPLTPTQETILGLLGCTADVYLKLTQHISKPLLK
jgi:transposase